MIRLSYKISWPALLQKTEEEVSKAEEFYSRDDPMTEIDKVRGTEMAYYEKAEDAIRKLEECLTPNSKVSPTEPIEVSRSEDEGKARIPSQSPVQETQDIQPDIPEERMSPRARDLYHKFPSHGEDEDARCVECGAPMNPVQSMLSSSSGKCADCIQKAHAQAVGHGEEEEEAPLDAKMVKSVLNDALLDATNLVQGIERYLETIEDLDFEDIDSAIEVVNSILQALKDAKQMGFPTPEEDDSGNGEMVDLTKNPIPVPSQDVVLESLSKGEA